MRNVARGLAGLIALLFLLFGFRFMFLPETAMASTGLEVVNNLGLATMRAFVGGSFLTFGILLVMHTVVNQQTGALRFSIMFLLFSIIGRIISFIADGTGSGAVRNLIPVSLMFIVSVISLVMFLRTEPEKH